MDSGHDVADLLIKARTRWLKPAEVLFILQNHGSLKIFDEPLQKPPSGTLILFKRSLLRYFRKDGHNWRIKEGHVDLKVGNVKALKCYYSTHEENPHFKRRCYWILNLEAREHIVLVHYRDLSQVRQIDMQSSPDPETPSPSINQGDIEEDKDNKGIKELHSIKGPQNVILQTKYTPKQDDDVPIDTNLGIEDEDWWEDADFDMSPASISRPRNDDIAKEWNDGHLLQEAHIRWLKPAEVLFILQNHKTVKLKNDPLQKPPSGTLILYNRKLLRNFRKDGHNWRIKEGHEHLTVGNVKALNCYYSTHKEYPDFKRRCYWMLNSKEHEHIVLVHYRDLSQVNAINSSPDLPPPNEPSQQDQILSSPGPGEVISGPGMDTNDHLHTRSFSADLDDFLESLKDDGSILYNGDLQTNANDPSSLPQSDEIEEETHPEDDDDIWKEMLHDVESPQTNFMPKPGDNGLTEAAPRFEVGEWWQEEEFHGHVARFRRSSISRPWNDDINKERNDGNDDSSGETGSEETGSGETSSQEQILTIEEISPEWGYASEPTKVIIIGSFYSTPSESVWTCMFGDIEVPAQLIQQGVIKCIAPPRLPGKVTLCIISLLGNQESTSEVGEFEYRAKPINLHETDSSRTREEQFLHTKFAQMLLSDNAQANIDSLSNSRADEESWKQVIEAVVDGTWTSSITTDWLLMEFLKDKLTQWLNYRSKEDTNQQGSCSLSKKEQGIIHMISGLGYEWALHPILKSGVSVNFRDANGWTPLHWAACFGREKIVATLMASGASAKSVTDPTPNHPVGRTPADIASAYGHSKLAGYLSELALTTHLSSLTLEETELSKGSVLVKTERTLSNVSSEVKKMDEISLAAVHNTALAATRIQSAFRAHSFRKREMLEAAKAFKSCGDVYSEKDIHKLSKTTFQKSRDYNKAAVLIQKKYRGYKGRKDFLAYRKKVVKIQAHIRGHQVRRQYHVTWAVDVLEKVMLRWCRHGAGLQGFRVETMSIDEREDADILKVFRKEKFDGVLYEALRRVLLMVENPEARQQYRSIVMKYRQAKVEHGGVEKERERELEDSSNDGFSLTKSR